MIGDDFEHRRIRAGWCGIGNYGILLIAAAFLCVVTPVVAAVSGGWIGSWAASPRGLAGEIKPDGSVALPPAVFQGTIRQRLRVSLGGSKIRLRLSNEYGDTPLEVRAVSVGLAGQDIDALPGTMQLARFAGKTSIVIPARSPALTDPIDLPVDSLGDIVVSVYVPNGVSMPISVVEPSKWDPALVATGDATLADRSSPISKVLRPLVSAVHVQGARTSRVIVALGDSITDGSVNPATGEKGWPGVLARRLQGRKVSVVNAGVRGNRLSESTPFFGTSALGRLEQDVLSVPGVSHVIVLEGINDIGGMGTAVGAGTNVSAEQLIVALSQIATRLHERGIKAIGATLLPFEGSPRYSVEKEAIRAEVNDWIRSTPVLDGVVDFDRVMRDPAAPRQLKDDYVGGDRLHPNIAGYKVMGNAIDLRLFR